MCKFIIPTDQKLSLEATGLLAKMINCPNMDHKTIDELTSVLKESYEEIEASLNELKHEQYVTRTNGIYSVNKQRISEMKIIYSAERIKRSFFVSEAEHKKLFG